MSSNIKIHGEYGQLIIEPSGKSCEVPDYPIAHIMYYLSCVDSCLDIDLSSKYTNYSNHRSLSFDDTNEVLKLAKDFSPSYMSEKGIFINDSDLTGDSLNQFYKITSKKANIALTTEFMYASREIHTVEIMAYETKWINNHYYNPIKEFSKRIRAIENGTIEELRPRSHSYRGPDKPIALLMYYLSCVDDIISIDIPNNFMNYRNYNRISFDDEIQILKLADMLKPSILIRNGVFVDKIQYCGDNTNKFYEIHQLDNKFSYKLEFMIGDRKVRTLKFMVFASSWVTKFYTSPMKQLSNKIDAIKNGTIEKLRPRNHSYNGSNESIPCLMYYLSCVNDLIDLEIPNALTNYRNYQNLSNEQISQLLSFILVFEPEFFIQKNLMINDLLICGYHTNKFYNTSEMMHKNPVLEFQFANKLIHSQKVMIYDKQWIEDFYNKPTKIENARLEAIKKGRINKPQPKNSDKSCLIQ